MRPDAGAGSCSRAVSRARVNDQSGPLVDHHQGFILEKFPVPGHRVREREAWSDGGGRSVPPAFRLPSLKPAGRCLPLTSAAPFLINFWASDLEMAGNLAAMTMSSLAPFRDPPFKSQQIFFHQPNPVVIFGQVKKYIAVVTWIRQPGRTPSRAMPSAGVPALVWRRVPGDHAG